MAGRSCFAVLLTLVLSACVAPASVKQYADATKQTADSVKPIAVDYAKTCQTRRALTPDNVAQALIKCDDIPKASEALAKVAKLLSDYGAALAGLSSDEVVDYKKEATDLASEVEKVPAFKGEKHKGRIDALTGIAQVLSNWAGRGYQEKKTVEVLNTSNAQVVTVSQALAEAMDDVAKEYKHEVEGMQEEQWRFGKAPKSGPDYAVWVMFNDWADTKGTALASKQQAAADLSEQIRKIGTINTDLMKQANVLTSAGALKVATAFYNDASPVWQKVHDAYQQ